MPPPMPESANVKARLKRHRIQKVRQAVDKHYEVPWMEAQLEVGAERRFVARTGGPGQWFQQAVALG